MSKLAYGTNVYAVNPLVGTVVEVTEIEEIEPGQESTDKMEDTPLSERKSKRYKTGLSDPGEGSIAIMVDSEEESHIWLYKESKKSNREELMFVLGWSDGDETVVPTFDSSVKKWVLPADRTWNAFNAEVATFPFSHKKGEIVKTNVALTRSGGIDWIPQNETRTEDKLWKRA